ncbi:hypothetical protein [Burkholderia sp. L27(2015)]|uniref:hypothetical protein n=1 Tax=Burkholderia sp. L27(2015) TaxID=1641858 RepID=UPI00131D4D76|nr:hypothetical protein [Burkholderia sp. L27(2015)]
MGFFDEAGIILSSLPTFVAMVAVFAGGYMLAVFVADYFYWPFWTAAAMLMVLLIGCLLVTQGWDLLHESFGDSSRYFEDVRYGVSSEQLWLVLKVKLTAAVVGMGAGVFFKSKFSD